MIPVIKYTLVIILIIISLYTDTKSYKIKNSFIVIFALAGLIVNCVEAGFSGLNNWAIGLILPITLLFLLFVLRMLGAGDIKLVAVIGGILGIRFLMDCSIYILVAAAIMALLKMLKERNLIKRFKHFFLFIWNIIINRQVGIYDDLNKEDKSHVIRLSYAIAAGVIYQIFLEIDINIFR